MLVTWGLTSLQFKHISQQFGPETKLLCLKNDVKSSERLGGEQQLNSQLLQMDTALLKPTEEHWLISEENLAYCLYWLIPIGKLQGQVLNVSVSFALLCVKVTETKSHVEDSKHLTGTVTNIAKSHQSLSPLPREMHCSISTQFCSHTNSFAAAELSAAQKHPTHSIFCWSQEITPKVN